VTNALGFYDIKLITLEKNSITQAPGATVIKKFFFVIHSTDNQASAFSLLRTILTTKSWWIYPGHASTA